jgi:hypothetical protein
MNLLLTIYYPIFGGNTTRLIAVPLWPNAAGTPSCSFQMMQGMLPNDCRPQG